MSSIFDDSVTISTDPPDGGTDGELWINPEGGSTGKNVETYHFDNGWVLDRSVGPDTPDNAGEGSLWIDSTTQKIFDPSNTQWDSIIPERPIKRLDEAATFTETDVSISGLSIFKNKLRPAVIGSDDFTFGHGGDDSPDSGGSEKINIKDWVNYIEFYVHERVTDVDYVSLELNGVEVKRWDNATSGNWFRFENKPISPTDTVYAIISLNSGNRTYNYDAGSVARGTHVEFADYSGDSISYFSGLRAEAVEQSSTGTIKFDDESVTSWDLMTHISNNNVTIDVIDATDNIIYSDIPRDFDVSTVSSDRNLGFQASVADYGSIDYLARRYL